MKEKIKNHVKIMLKKSNLKKELQKLIFSLNKV